MIRDGRHRSPLSCRTLRRLFDFTMPLVLALIIFGYGVIAFEDALDSGVLQGLKVVAVAQAV